jgi:PhzF family phenazine biosynthesis protein
MALPLYQVDAFTDTPFAGNPAAVGLCFDALPGEEQFQQIAAEMNLSETAFVMDRPGEHRFALCWFTPTREVDLCGHATLAAAHVLWSDDGPTPPDAGITFHTRSGPLTARRAKRGRWIQLDFPAEPVEPCDAPAGLADALGAAPTFTGRNRMDLLARFDEAQTVRDLAPDVQQLSAIDARGVIATAEAETSAGCHFVSRFFAPGAGIDEDPVTGSAHCALAPFWSERLRKKRLTGRQVSARGGRVRCEVQDGGERVTLGGQAVTVLRGELTLR